MMAELGFKTILILNITPDLINTYEFPLGQQSGCLNKSTIYFIFGAHFLEFTVQHSNVLKVARIWGQCQGSI